MRYLALTLALCALLAAAWAQVNGAGPQRALQLAQVALKNQELQQAITNSPLASHPMFTDIFSLVDMRDLNNRAASLMAQRFTEQELSALVDFQNSTAGRSIQTKMPGFQLEVGAMVNNVMTQAFQRYMASKAGAGGASSLPVQGTPLR
jgi:hypothetical protein